MDDKDWANRIVISPIEIHLGYKEFLESVLMQSDMGPGKYKTPTTDDINLEDWVVDLLAVLTEFAKNGWRVHVERMNVNARILEDVKAKREECGLDGDMVDPWMIHIYIYTQDTLDRYHEMKKEIPEDDFSNLEVYTLFEKRLVNTVVIDPEMFSVHWRDLADRLINPEEGDPIVVDMPTDNEGCNPSEPGNDTNEPAPINGNQIESENK